MGKLAIVLGIGAVAVIAVVAVVGSSSLFDSDEGPTNEPVSQIAPDPVTTAAPDPKAEEPSEPAEQPLAETAKATGQTDPASSSSDAEVARTDDKEAGSDPDPSPSEPSAVDTRSVVDPDPDWRAKLDESRIRSSPSRWETDFSRHTVPFTEVFSGGVSRDGIPPIYDPKHVGIEESDLWLADQEPVVTVEIAGDARAYPLQVLTWHEIANDTVGGVPVAVTFCPLCNSAIAFDRRLDGVVHKFGVSGNLRNSDLIMWDHETETWWQQLTGEGIIGTLAGRRLSILPAPIVSYGDFKAAHPDGLVLSKETEYGRPYGMNPYAGYDRVDVPPFLFMGDLDGRLLPKERVAAVTVDGIDVAFPYRLLREEGAVNYTAGDTELVVFFKSGTVSALDQGSIADSREVGATAVYSSDFDGRMLTFQTDGEAFVDDQTGSRWNILGEAIDGPLSGSSLEPIVSADHFWFAWGAFKPDTLIYSGMERADAVPATVGRGG